uniref:CARD domain-containing protein n=1 Tax=Nothobranchius furzeri TaxID=105023 RepID=A0A8C6LI49_NOTFU
SPSPLYRKHRLRIWIGFISGISEPVLKSLLDKLLEKNVVQDYERDAALAEKEKGDKARFVIIIVRKNGHAASSEMIESLCDLDPFFSEHLGLM